MKKFVEEEKDRLAKIQHCKNTYPKYLFENLLRIFYWYYNQGIAAAGSQAGNSAKSDYRELIEFVYTLKSKADFFSKYVRQSPPVHFTLSISLYNKIVSI